MRKLTPDFAGRSRNMRLTALEIGLQNFYNTSYMAAEKPLFI
jgi:hypothetical protein